MGSGRGLVSNRTLTDIANAIRWQQRSDAGLTPGAMGAAVAALDGSHDGAAYGESDLPVEQKGFVWRASLQAVADSIRAQNGGTSLYKPRDMAEAIRALAWASEPSLVALLLDDGTLEFSWGTAHAPSDGSAGTVASYAVDGETGYSSASDVPWYGARDQVVKVSILASVADAGVVTCANWFNGCRALTEVRGFEHLDGATNLHQTFYGCSRLESVYCDGAFDVGSVTGRLHTFAGCKRLVGADCATADSAGSGSLAVVGGAGLLVSKDEDNREWAWCHYFEDGGMVVAPAEDYSASGRTLVAKSRVCLNAKYQGCPMPGVNETEGCSSADCTAIAFDAALLTCGATELHIDHWCRGMSNLTSVAGLENLANLRTMNHTFQGCVALTRVDFGAMDATGINGCISAFSGCAALATIGADVGWAFHQSVASSGTFSGCTSLVGGAGTTFSAGHTNSDYFRIDTATTPGYLTETQGL